jgi:hypothetical protein
MTMRTRGRGFCVVVVVGVLAGCAGTPATAEQQQLAERRLLQPFLQPIEVGCGELQLDITANFNVNVGRPAIDAQMHTATKERGPGYVESVWTNKTGDMASAFVVTVGEAAQITETGVVQGPRTTFTVVNQVRLRVYEERRSLTLNAVAAGPFVFVKEAAGAPREVKEFAVVDGALRTR